jgi:serine/threonine protein kinase
MPADFDVRYTNLQRIGKGGFGVVYRAHDARLDRDVAIKLLNPEFAADPAWRKRFRQEATAASRLNHPNITIVFDRNDDENQLYIVMEFVEGRPLSSFIQERIPLTDLERLQLIEQLCDGLQYAHQRQIVHRDIKPVNLMVRDEPDGARTLKILDFGIAKIANAGQTITGGQLLCTPNYVAPEQIRGVESDHRSDIFAVGAVAYELLVLEKAFVIGSSNPYALLEEMRRKIVEEPHRPMTDLRPDLDPALVSIVDCALAKAPEDRYRDLGEMRRGLRKVRERLEAVQSADTVVLNPSLQRLLTRVGQLMREENPSAAIEVLEADFPFAPNQYARRLIEERIEEARQRKERQERDADAAIAAATAAFLEGAETVAFRVLERFEPRALVKDHFAHMKRAAALVAATEQLIRQGSRAGRETALRDLEQFQPAHLMTGAAKRLRALAEELTAEEARVRVSATRAIAQAQIEFAAGNRREAITVLEQFQPGELVARALSELRAAARLVDRTAGIVHDGPVDARDRALAELAAFEPGDLVARVVEELRSVASAREARDRQANEEALAARAHAIIASARDAFRNGSRADAIAKLKTFEDRLRVEDALQSLYDAARRIQDASTTIQSADREARRSALAKLAAFADPELVEGALSELRRIDEQRRAEEDRDSAVHELVKAAREQFDRGDQAGALDRLQKFAPPDPIVTAELVTLRERATKLENERRERETRELIASARADFAQGWRVPAIALLESDRSSPQVEEAPIQLRRADALIARGERAIAHGDKADRGAALDDLARFEPADLVIGALEALRRQSAQREFEESKIEQAQARAAWERAASDAVSHAHEAFAAGRRAEALTALKQFAKPELVIEPLAELQRLAALLDGVEDRVRTGAASDRAAALEDLERAEPFALIESALAAFRQLDAERSVEERDRAEEARAARAIAEAKTLFERGQHFDAIGLLDAYSPRTPQIAAGLDDLRAKAKKIADDLAQAELAKAADATKKRAYASFISGQIDEALATLTAFQPPGLVADELETLRRAAREIEVARTTVTTATAPARRAALEQMARLAPADLFRRPLAELNRINDERTADELRQEMASLATEAERTSKAARAAFRLGKYDAAVTALERFYPAPLVESTLNELRRARREIGDFLRTVAEADDPVRQQAIEKLRAFRPTDLVARALEQGQQEHLRRRSDEERTRLGQEHRSAAQRVAAEAQQAFDAGRTDAAVQLLEAFTPPHAIVSDLLTELRLRLQVSGLVLRGSHALRSSELADAARLLADAYRLRPNDPAVTQLREAIDAQKRQALMQRVRRSATRFGAPALVVLGTVVAGLVFWPDSPSNTPSPSQSALSKEPKDTSRNESKSIPRVATAPDSPRPSKSPAPVASPDSATAFETQLETFRKRAQQQFAEGQMGQALETLEDVLKLKNDDRESRRLRDAINGFRKASTDTANARRDAIKVGAPRTAAATFGAGVQREEQADRDRRQGRIDQAMKGLSAAREAFSEATAEASAAEAAVPSTRPAERKPTEAPGPVEAKKTAPPPPNPDVVAPPVNPDTPAVATPPRAEPPPEPRLNEDGRVRDTLGRYAAAYHALSVSDLKAVYPSVLEAAVRKSFEDKDSYDIDLQVQRIDISADARSATAVCRVTHAFQPKAGKRQLMPARVSTFTLTKLGNNWVIERIR